MPKRCLTAGEHPPPDPLGAVKMRRGLTARVFDEVRTMSDLYRWYLLFLHQLADKAAHEVDSNDPNVKV